MSKDADIHTIKMMLRKIRDNMEDTEKLVVSLKTLSKYKRTNANFLCEPNRLNILVLTVKHHQDDPVILKLTISILKWSLAETANAIDASTSACRM